MILQPRRHGGKDRSEQQQGAPADRVTGGHVQEVEPQRPTTECSVRGDADDGDGGAAEQRGRQHEQRAASRVRSAAKKGVAGYGEEAGDEQHCRPGVDEPPRDRRWRQRQHDLRRTPVALHGEDDVVGAGDGGRDERPRGQGAAVEDGRADSGVGPLLDFRRDVRAFSGRAHPPDQKGCRQGE